MCHFVKQCFSTQLIPEEINATQIVLIPKLENPETLKQFRPLSLCNVTYKTITKIIVNRLRPMLSELVSPNQSSFIPGRTTTDNIIITQEIIHTLRSKKGKIGGMVLKIDLEKSYDRISWDFIRHTLKEFNLNPIWVNLIMNCVSNVNSSIIWNGEVLPSISVGKGLRQGDPLSPYLFVLCMENLSNMIRIRTQSGDWQGLKASRNSPLSPISFLLMTLFYLLGLTLGIAMPSWKCLMNSVLFLGRE